MLVVPTVLFMGLFFPESPCWLVGIGGPEAAKSVLIRLRGNAPDAVTIVAEIGRMQISY